jgi:hypothetical protein
MPRRFPAPWSVEQIPGGLKVVDATGQALAYVHGHTTQADADAAKGLTLDEARRVASKHRQAADAVIGKALILEEAPLSEFADNLAKTTHPALTLRKGQCAWIENLCALVLKESA